MIDSIGNVFRIPELKRRILFVLGAIFIFRLGAHIPTPGIDTHAMNALVTSQAGGFLGFYDLFSGGALRNFTIFSLGIMPYISASIIMQLLTAVIPSLEALSKEGEAGRKKITQYTRYLTVGICAIQSIGITFWLKSMKIVLHYNLIFVLTTILTLTAGTIFLMWLGEQMTEYGVGNGMSMLIFAGILARIPLEIGRVIEMWRGGSLTLFQILLFVGIIVILTGVAVISQQSYRRIPVQYAQRIVGRKVYRGQSTQLPLKIDYSGVIAVIFASAVMIFPSMITKLFEGIAGKNEIFQAIFMWVNDWLAPGKPLYMLFYAGLIIFFCYFYTAITFNPNDVADNMKKYGGFVPGIRPGKPTADYINDILTHITLGGAILVVIIAIIPDFLGAKMGIGMYFGGTTLLIVVGVALDTLQQVESHLLMRHYEGFMKTGKIRGRRI